MRWLVRSTWAVVLMALLACEEDSGPGEWLVTASVEGRESLGAVVMQVNGVGVDAFKDGAGTRVFGEPSISTNSATSQSRLVAVGSGGRSLSIVIGVLDVASGAPSVTVVDAVSGQDLPLASQTVTTTVERR